MGCRLALAAALLLAGFIAAPQSLVAQGGPPQGPPPDDTTPTPRTPDGHPDLTGDWGFRMPAGLAKGFVSEDGKERAVLFGVPQGDIRNIGTTIPAQRRLHDKNRPPYKPELEKKVEDLDDHSNQTDPTGFSCLPPGIPRIGTPSQIMESPGWVVFFYNENRVRVIPTDGRPHLDAEPAYLGDSVGHWEGDTLVVDVTHLNDETWMGPGYFHSDALHVVELFTRKGNTLRYEATVEDPNVLTQPWVLTPRTLRMAGPFHQIEEDAPCVEHDKPHLVTNQTNP
jgi:hypothetical protein